MDDKKRMTGLLIHGFAVAHAATAAIMAQTIVGDEAALTALTIAMIITVAKMNGADWDTGTALAFLSIFIGNYVGVRGATMLIKWIPGIGNAANAAATFATTEALGWATYIFIEKGKTDPRSMSSAEKDDIWKKAKEMRESESKESERLYKSMTEEDKKEYKSILDQMRDKKLPEKTRDYLLDRLEKIVSKYV